MFTSLDQKADKFWITISMYCGIEYWSKVLLNLIRPLLKKIDSNPSMEFYLLQLDTTENPAINLILKIIDGNIQRPTDILTEHINYYSEKFSHEFEADAKPFEIKYSPLRIPYAISVADHNLFYFGKEVSYLIIKAAEHNTMTEDELLILSVYIHLGWIKARYTLEKIDLESILLEGHCGGTSNNSQAVETLHVLTDAFKENKDAFMEIYDSVMNPSTIQDKGIPSLFTQCHSKILENRSSYKDEPVIIEIANYLIPSLINSQLGLSPGMIFAQTFFLHQMIKTGTINNPF